jgi:hypothetical protein
MMNTKPKRKPDTTARSLARPLDLYIQRAASLIHRKLQFYTPRTRRIVEDGECLEPCKHKARRRPQLLPELPKERQKTSNTRARRLPQMLLTVTAPYYNP